MEGEGEESLLGLPGPERDGVAGRLGLAGGPPELDVFKDVGDLLAGVGGHGEDHGLGVGGDRGLEVLGLGGRAGVEVALDGGVGGAALEGVVGFVFGEVDGDVRVEEVEELFGVVFDGGGDFVREEVLEHGVGEH